MECLICKKTFTGLENYDKHLQSQEHKQKILDMQERQNDLPNESEAAASSLSNCEGKIRCNVCDLSFEDFESFQDHSVTPQHALKIMLKQATSNGSSNQSSVMTNYELNAVKSKVEATDNDCILPELNKSSNFSSNYGKCEVCAKTFSGPEPYKQHLESHAHKRKVALQQNSTYATGSMLKCEPCNKSFSGQMPYIQHMSSETHRKKLRNIQAMEDFIRVNSTDSQAGIKENVAGKEDWNKIFFCDVCKRECSGLIPYQQHLDGIAHFKNLKRLESLNNFTTQLPINKVSEASENATQINGSCERDNEREDDPVYPKQIELGKIIKIISCDGEIKFDHLDSSEESTNEMPALTKQDENQNNEISSPINNCDEKA